MFCLVADNSGTNRHGWIDRVGLREHSDAQVVAMRYSAAVWFESLRQNLHESRLAVTVSTDDSNSITIVDADGY